MKHKISMWLFICAAMSLAVMGCWFCWHCPSRIYPPETHSLFWRQLAWNGVGLAVFTATWLTGWKRLLKAAPWLMVAWLVAIGAAQFLRPVNGVHKWLPIGPVRVNVMTCFIPVIALFAAWLHEKKWIRPWMEWVAVAVAVIWAVWHIVGSDVRMERLAAFFNPVDWVQARAFMAHQLLAAFYTSNWFGDAGRSLGFLPCPANDGMLSASALIFGKWFTTVLVWLFAVAGASLTLLWKGAVSASKRRFMLLFGLWLIAPTAYCLLHSLAFLPVAGMSPALASYSGTAIVMAWFGIGVIAAMWRCESSEHSSDIKTATKWCISCVWGALAGMALLLIALAPKREFLRPDGYIMFFEPRPSDMEFGEFGFIAKRGRILAADGSPLAYTVRAWRFYLDPCVPNVIRVFNKDSLTEIADGLGIPVKNLLEYYIRANKNFPDSMVCEVAEELGVSLAEIHDKIANTDTNTRSPNRYIFLMEVDDGSPTSKYFDLRHRWLTKFAGIIREPTQKRVYPFGDAATAAIGFMHRVAHTETPWGAGGLESSFDKTLAGTNGVYDTSLRLDERKKRATPVPGADIQTTIVPDILKTVSGIIAAACATNGAESAFALVMKVPSGEIAAMASCPTFDPSMRRDLDKWNSEMAVNRATQVLFEPGGLTKPLTYAIALDSGAMTEDAKIDQENGVWEYNGVTINDCETNALSIAEAIACRANIAAGKAASLIGPEKFHAALLHLGFGSKTGAAGMPSEAAGIIADKPEHWDTTTAMRVGMGYGFAATGLQIAQAYATLANNGTLVRPVLVKTEATNSVVQVVSPSSADAIVRMLNAPMPSTVQMCERDHESGQTVYSPTNYIASCAGFVPADKPEYVVVVSFFKPQPAHTGEEIATPVFIAIKDAL